MVSTDTRHRVTVAEAESLILGNLKDWGTQRVPLAAAGGEILRETLVTERDQPPFDRVTMDGVAIRYSAFAAGRHTFALVGTQGAGGQPIPVPDDRSCVAIMTGAALPPGTDSVVPVERLVRDGQQITIHAGYQPQAGQFVHRQGSDHGRGAVVLVPGCRLGPTEMAVLTTTGNLEVEVARRPQITVASTGDELVDVGLPMTATQIRSSNDRAIAAALATRGFSACRRRHLPDDRAVLEHELAELLATQDVLILSGGVSMGEFDFVPTVLADLGVRVIFHKVLQKPGLPLWFGVSPDGKPVFALPGNPVSSLVCLVRYVAPALLAALGATPSPPERVRLGTPLHFEPAMTWFVPTVLHYEDDGQCLAMPRPPNTSGDFISLGGTDGFIELPADRVDFPAGFPARFFRWS
ncbi:MAG: molybdopterin molybdotransferase MoeA [Gammaproteobacteria bacterium]